MSEKPEPLSHRAGQQAANEALEDQEAKMVEGEAVSPGADPVLERALAKISRRVIPLFTATVFMNFLDRSKWVGHGGLLPGPVAFWSAPQQHAA